MLRNNIKAIRRNARKMVKSQFFRAKIFYTTYFDEGSPLIDNQILFQSFDGNRFGGNPFYILESLYFQKSRNSYNYIVAVKREALDKTRNLLSAHGIHNCAVVELHSRDYCKYLSNSKYLINNATFPSYFIKREGQVYLNTWHGTPLKCMGRKIGDSPWSTGNVQRNFIMADYLLYPNQYSFEHFTEDYMIDQLYSGKYVLSGYPCNSIFFDEKRRNEIREAMGLQDKKVIAYLPTWRVTQKGGHGDKHDHMIQFVLENLDEHLNDNAVVIAQPHYYDSSAASNFDNFNKVLPFPECYETYEVLNIADVLVTDYSSVMFDYLNRGKEIVLFNYDEDEYFSTRGTYFPLSELPFAKFKDPYSLCEYLNGHDYSQKIDYNDLRLRFAPFDDREGVSRLTSLIFDNSIRDDRIRVIEGASLHNGKPNILLYGGGLAKNGITSALQGLLENFDYSKANIVLTFKRGAAARNGADFFATLDKRVAYFPIQGNKDLTLAESFARFSYYRRNRTDKRTTNRIKHLFEREAIRCFYNIRFDSVIHFSGYERDLVHTLLACNSDNKIIYVHSDMAAEKKLKGNFHVPSLERAYREFDRIAVVREGLPEVMEREFGVDPSRIYVVHNLNKIAQIIHGATLPISFGDNTISNVSLDELNETLNDSNKIKFISIGRFSPEKALLRLTAAFDRIKDDHCDAILILIGGSGPEYPDVMAKAEEIGFDRLMVIKNMPNPFSVLVKSDVFIMASLYEGLPMSIMEALILGKPVVCTDIPGPRSFLESGSYGYIVPNNEDGLVQAFNSYYDGALNGLQSFNADVFNRKALSEFYQLVNMS